MEQHHDSEVVESQEPREPTNPGVVEEHFESSVDRGKRLTSLLVIVSLIFGLLGGVLGTALAVHFLPGAVNTQDVAVQESSAIITVAKKVSPSVVAITSQAITPGLFGGTTEEDGAGSGIIVNANGLIMTNRHVVSDTTAKYTVVLSNGKKYTDAQVIARDPLNDIAFVKVNTSNLPAVQLGDSSSVQVGQQVVAIGNALGQYQNSVTHGIISGLGRPVTAADNSSQGLSDESLDNLFQTDAAINPGNSGGPLIDLDGRVIGINTAVAGQGAQNIGFAIPINETKALIMSVEQKGKIVTPYLGVRYVDLTPDVASANNLSTSYGAWVQGDSQNPAIVSGSPAEHAGLKSGDIITRVDNTVINQDTSLQSVIGLHSVGDKITLTIVRNGKQQTIHATLGQAPSGS
jgi:serine protease Do